MSDPVLEALNRAPEEMSAQDLDHIIAYLRKSKQQHDSGMKPKKEGADVDALAVLNIKPKDPEGFVKRI